MLKKWPKNTYYLNEFIKHSVLTNKSTKLRRLHGERVNLLVIASN